MQAQNSPSLLLLKQIFIFLVVFMLLQVLWSFVRLTDFGLWFIEGLTIHTSTGLINMFTPQVRALAQGTHIASSGGSINVLNGCEGIEVVFILIAAMLVAPLTWRSKLLGILAGVSYVFAMNQIRLVAMFYAIRTNRQLFETVHGLVGPILLVAITGLFFAYWLSKFAVSTSKVKDDQAISMATTVQTTAASQNQTNLVFPPS